jgi:hypothetical protein
MNIRTICQYLVEADLHVIVDLYVDLDDIVEFLISVCCIPGDVNNYRK